MNEKAEKEVKQEFVTILSEGHTYQVPIMNTVDGIGFAVRYPDMFGGNLDRKELEELVKKKVVHPDVLFAFSLNLMAGMKIDDDTCDDVGMCALFRKKPSELYQAIIIALCANFGDCFPFLEDLSDTEESPSPA